MKFLKHFALALMCCMATMAAWAQQQQLSDDDQRVRDRITEAVMGVYNRALEANPDDYDTRFARANQLYYNGEYQAAIDDAKIVLDQLPKKDKESRVDTYLLLARLYDITQQYEDEVEALRQVSELSPNNLACVDMLGKVALKMNDVDAAERNFKIILRESPMNYDAHYQLALVELARNNYGKAVEYVDKAVELFTAEPQVYINRADVLTRMQQYEPAAQDLISAMSVGSNESKAINSLVAMSDVHYESVMKALSESIDKAPQVGTFYYVKASIAMRHYHYGQALHALNAIVANNLYDHHIIYYYQALCQSELLMWDDAKKSIDRAIALEPEDTEYYLLQARIAQYGANDMTAAMKSIQKANSITGDQHAVLLAKARLLIAQRNDEQALEALRQALVLNATSPEALLMRGWLYKYRLKNEKAAKADFKAVVDQEDKSIYSLRGFALHELQRDDEARQWARDIIQEGILPGGRSYIEAAALMSDIGDEEAGDKQQARDYLRSALANGFGSRFELEVNEEPYVNLKLARRYEDFEIILKQNEANFAVKR